MNYISLGFDLANIKGEVNLNLSPCDASSIPKDSVLFNPCSKSRKFFNEFFGVKLSEETPVTFLPGDSIYVFHIDKVPHSFCAGPAGFSEIMAQTKLEIFRLDVKHDLGAGEYPSGPCVLEENSV
jgi:hypothetical protein